MQMINTDVSIPFGGWALAQALTLDQQGARGLVADICRTQPALKRQASFLALSSLICCPVADFLARLAERATTLTEALRTHTARELAKAALAKGDVTNSYIRALERIGNNPLSSPEDYGVLYEMCAARSPAYMALRHCRIVTSARIHAAQTLDPRLLCASVLDGITCSSDVQLVEDATNVFVQACSILETEAGWRVYRDYLGNLGVYGVERMLKHADQFPAPPYACRPELTPISSADQMTRLGAKYRNCLATRVPYVLLGHSFYYVVNLEALRSPVFVELQPLTNGAWKLHHVEGPKGTELTEAERKRVITYFVGLGAVVVRGSAKAAKLGQLFHAYSLDFSVSSDELEDLAV